MSVMRSRQHRQLGLLVCAVLVAAACGGEVTDPALVSDAEGEAAEPEPQTAQSGAGTTESAREAAQPELQTAASGAGTTESDREAAVPETESAAAEPDTAASGSDAAGTGAAETGGAETGAAASGTDMAVPGAEVAPSNIYDDPRDGIFDEFQATMDRGDHPFMQLDAFCHAHDPAPDRVATDSGIGADSISLVHVRSRLEDLVAYGFASAVGDVAEMFDTFTAVVNEQCGGVRGRAIDMHTLEIAVAGDTVDQEGNAACIEGTEDLHGVILLNTSGFPGSGALCIVEAHETALVTGSTMPSEFMRRGSDRLVSLDPTAEDQMTWLALDLIQRGDLDGKTVGVAAPDTPGEFEPIEAGLVHVLQANGVEVAVFEQIGCQGGSFCTVGVQETVQRMRAGGVDVVFNMLNAVSLPGFITEMVNQGYEPGDVQFYGSEFNSAGVEIVASKVVAFGGEAAGRLYNGTVIQSVLDTGSYRLDGYEPRKFNEMCNDTYGANSASGANHESEDRAAGVEAYGMVALVCEVMRIALRAVYDAGDNPTRADIYKALASLGPVDSLGMIPASIRPGKTATPDATHYLVFEYPCEQRAPFGDENICIYPITEYRPAPS